MTKILCDAYDCFHCSRRKSKTFSKINGQPLYGCKMKEIIISPIFDPDGDVSSLLGKETCECRCYKTVEVVPPKNKD